MGGIRSNFVTIRMILVVLHIYNGSLNIQFMPIIYEITQNF